MAAILALSAPLSKVSAQDYEPVHVTVSNDKVKLNGKVYFSHVVLERQTLYSISKAYGVSIEEITAANPSIAEKGLQKNSIILIPSSKGTEAPTVQLSKNEYKTHTVKWFETLDDIAAKYGIPKRDIMEVNALTSEKLTKRQKLKIPLVPIDRSRETVPENNVSAPAEKDTVATAPVVDETSLPDKEEGLEPKDPEWDDFEADESGREIVNVALVMPFNAGGRPGAMNMDFYAGVLLAVKDLEDAGIGTHLSVYDTQSTPPTADQLKANDFILGPVSTADLAKILEKTSGKVPVISPIDQRAITLKDTYSNFIQAPTPVENQYSDIVSWVKSSSSPSDKVILITEKGGKGSSVTEALLNMLNASRMNYSTLSYSLIEGRNIQNSLIQKMGAGNNRVIVATESEAFLGDILRNIGIAINKGYEVTVYAPSKVRSFDTIDPMNYHTVNMHMSSSYSIDYDDPAVRKFVLAYRALYKTEPNQFAFQGYDTAYYFIGMFSKYGRKWARRLTDTKGHLLHTDFLFSRSGNGSLVNNAIRRTVYHKDSSTTHE